MNKPASVTIFVLALLAPGCSSLQPSVQVADVPGKLKPGAAESLSMVVPAQGVQIYECRAGKDGSYQWAFIAPEAELFDARGRRIGRHYGGASSVGPAGLQQGDGHPAREHGGRQRPGLRLLPGRCRHAGSCPV